MGRDEAGEQRGYEAFRRWRLRAIVVVLADDQAPRRGLSGRHREMPKIELA